MLRLALDQYEYAAFDFGRNTTFRLYQEDGSTVFDATGYTGVMKAYLREGDARDFVFVDVSRAIGLLRGRVAQIISDIPVTFTDQANGVGTFAFNQSQRPNLTGFLEIQIQLSQSGEVTSSELVRVNIRPSLAA